MCSGAHAHSSGNEQMAGNRTQATSAHRPLARPAFALQSWGYCGACLLSPLLTRPRGTRTALRCIQSRSGEGRLCQTQARLGPPRRWSRAAAPPAASSLLQGGHCHGLNVGHETVLATHRPHCTHRQEEGQGMIRQARALVALVRAGRCHPACWCHLSYCKAHH
jgi:hypothetical protein